MKKIYVVFSLVVALMVSPIPSEAKTDFEMPEKDSRELQYQDMSMIFLGPYLDKAVTDYYSIYLTKNPIVYPYQIQVVNVERIDQFREFHFKITLEVTPVVGPHISVGKDRLIFEVAPTIPNKVKLLKYDHLETHDLPPVWMHILRKKPTL